MSNNWEDKATAIRKGEELDTNALQDFLRTFFSNRDTLHISQFSSGYSNLTYLIEYGEAAYVLRRPPFGANIKSGHDMHREYKILNALSSNYKKTPKPIVYSDDLKVIGAPFYIMEHVKGVILRSNMPIEMQPSATLMSGIAKSFIETLVSLHQIDIKGVGLDTLGKPEGYIKRQVEGWSRRYFKAKTDDVPKIEAAAKWLHENRPQEQAYSLIHNDFKYDNLVLDKDDWTHVKAVLDWEMATIGDSMMDLGTTLGYWVNHNDPDFMKDLKLNPTTLEGNLTREELVHQYLSKKGLEEGNITFYYVYGLFKIAVIMQQIYFRYKNGMTNDPRFDKLIKGVYGMGEVTSQAISKNKIENLF